MNDDVIVLVTPGKEGILSLLELDVPRDSPSLLRVVSGTLFQLRVQIVRVHARHEGHEGRWKERLWLVDFDGGPLSAARCARVREALVRALEDFALIERARCATLAFA